MKSKRKMLVQSNNFLHKNILDTPRSRLTCQHGTAMGAPPLACPAAAADGADAAWKRTTHTDTHSGKTPAMFGSKVVCYLQILATTQLNIFEST